MKEIRDGVATETKYDATTDKIITKTTYDPSDVLASNASQRNEYTKAEQYKGKFVHAAKIHMGDVERLRNIGYNLLSNDPEEWKRCLLYIQQSEPWLLTVDGKPFAKNRVTWQ